MAKTNKELVAYAVYQLGNPYWYGTFGQIADNELLEAKTKQYPRYYTPARMPKYRSQFGKRVFDCVGLVKGCLWSETPDSNPKYNAAQDVSSNGMRDVCRESGSIGSIPELPGVLVFKDGHMGVYIGLGDVIEARGFNYGVVKTKLNARGWTSWGKCPWIDYGGKSVYFPKYTGNSNSIVDGLNAVGAESSYAYRTKIAAKNNIANYKGTPVQNTEMLNMLKRGTLKVP